MKLGVIARSEDRGLGIQTWEACRHLNPDRVLLVTPPWDLDAQHPERYDDFDTLRVDWLPKYRLEEVLTRRWLSGLDVVYTAETFYDLRLPGWAKEHGCTVVCHANPEMTHRRLARHDVTWWAPSPWRLDEMPEGCRYVPMPVATDRLATRTPSNVVRFLHVVGRQADKDRNGTRILAAAVAHLRGPAHVIVRGLDAMPVVKSHRDEVTVDWQVVTVPNYWDLYRDADVLVMPRRYGGLCLPAQEAMAAGMPVIMSDCSPNEIWPGPRIPTNRSKPFDCMGGRIVAHDADHLELAAVMDDLATNPTQLDQLRDEAQAWVATHSWEALTPHWVDLFEQAARRCLSPS